MTSPCRGCPDRHEACHDRCERYKAWKAPLVAAYEDRRVGMMQLLTRKDRHNNVAAVAKKKHLKG